MSLLGLGLAEESSQLVSLLTPESKIGGTAVVIGVIIIVVTTINCCFTIDGSSYVYYFVKDLEINSSCHYAKIDFSMQVSCYFSSR